jgi:AhpD family alkylhydroperoxidase
VALRLKEKELAAVGISVVTGCKPCTDYHVKAAREARASDDEIKRAVADALAVRRGATDIMEGYVLAKLGAEAHGGNSDGAGEPNRVKALVCVGAAFGVNCVSNLEKHLAAAENAGITQEEIGKILKISAFIKGRAVSHVERACGMREAADKQEEQAEALAAYNAAFSGA